MKNISKCHLPLTLSQRATYLLLRVAQTSLLDQLLQIFVGHGGNAIVGHASASVVRSGLRAAADLSRK